MGKKKTNFLQIWCCSWSFVFFSLVQSIPIILSPDSSDGELLNTTTFQIYNQSTSVCIYQDVVYPSGKNFVTNNPCETCICQPPKYTCTTQNCDAKPGCKAIHKPNVCCPEYVCRCEKDGKTYENGEKVEEVNPCKVCYCSGGQIKCSFVTCYLREDCKAVFVKGRCCPKYDDCPPLEKMENKMKTPEPTAISSDFTVEKIQTPEEANVTDTVPLLTDVTSSSFEDKKLTGSVATLEIIEIYETEATPLNNFHPQTYNGGFVYEKSNNFYKDDDAFGGKPNESTKDFGEF